MCQTGKLIPAWGRNPNLYAEPIFWYDIRCGYRRISLLHSRQLFLPYDGAKGSGNAYGYPEKRRENSS